MESMRPVVLPVVKEEQVNGLFNSTILDVIIGLLFVYLLLAILCTTVNEWVAGWMGLRSKNLQSGIRQLLDSQKGVGNDDADWFLQQFYKHPLITGMLRPGDRAHPSYLPSRTFAAAVIDVVTPQIHGALGFQDLENGVQNLPDGDVKKALFALLQNAHRDLESAQRNIENWFDDTMDRASGWYKRKTQLVTAVLAVAITVLANADTVRMVRTLQQSSTERSVVFEKAKLRMAQQGSTAAPLAPDEKSALGGLLGWTHDDLNSLVKVDPWKILAMIFGWLLTIIAVSLGAPFWFDVLNKLMNIRNAGDKPEKAETQPQKPAEASPGLTEAKTL
jgi:hypothetical protein